MAGVDAGGIVAAGSLLAEHGASIEADLQRYYRIHIGDFPARLTPRRLKVLIEALPPDAATWASMRATPALDPAVTYAALARHGITIPDELRRR